jgi:hypothetical protein
MPANSFWYFDSAAKVESGERLGRSVSHTGRRVCTDLHSYLTSEVIIKL